jgi:DNA polymerase III delta prime subunit
MNKQIAKKIKRIAEKEGLEFRDDYSGRCMFGKTCVGIVGDKLTCAAVAKYVQKKIQDAGLFCNVCSDNMGLDMIYYFPQISVNR